ncbi:hypothetical protein Tco_1230773 [Tanacetum coccineum]
MSITKEQQQALDDALVPREQRLQIGSCNYILSIIFKPKEPTFQVALDVLSLTPFYPAFLITASVPTVYMHDFWATTSYHKHSIRFKLNTKSYSFDLDTFINMLQMCLKLPGQKFVDPLFEEEILTFIRELGYSGNIKLLSDVKVDILPQPWRTFGTIINKCLSGKVTGIDSLRLSRAQILWGLYHQKKVDYVYLLWEDLVFQIENKESWKTKYIFIPQHEVVQKYGAILPDNLTTQAMKESETYKTYYAFATEKAIPKPKYVRRTTKEKSGQAPKASFGKRIKSAAKMTRSGKKKKLVEGLETLSEIALSEVEKMKLAIERSKTQLHSSQPSGSGAHEGTGKSSDEDDDDDESNLGKDKDDDNESNLDKDEDDDDHEDNDDQDNDNDQDDGNERIDSDNDGDDFVHPKFSTHDEKDKEEDSFDPRVQTPSHVESTDDEDNDEEIQGANVEGDKQDEDETNEKVEANELYRDVNVNLEGQDIEITNAQQTNVQPTQVT